jgi:hypothetical protein
MKNTKLKKIQPHLPQFIQDRIEEVLNEEEAYAADELVELCEAILNELAAIGFAVYLKQKNQKEVHNDFLIQLFTSKSSGYNAGPLYRWAANMLKDAETEEAKKIKHLFWEKDGKELNKAINGLSFLRNKVIHGFFVLPPDNNRVEAEHIADVLEELIKIDFFKVLKTTDFHFLKIESAGITYSGNWNITDEDWKALDQTYRFGEVAKAIRFQLSKDFAKEEHNKILASKEVVNTHEIEALFKTKQKGAYAFWQSPYEINNLAYCSLVNKLTNDKEFATVYYELTTDGITFTSDFLLRKIVNELKEQVDLKKISSNPQKAIQSITKATNKQIIVVVNHIETALFNKNHLLHLVDFFYENNIILVAFGDHHPWMDRFFNNSIKQAYKVGEMKGEWKNSLNNYLRFKGPFQEKEEDREDYNKLAEIGENLIKAITQTKEVVARRFADDNDYPIEYVHELFEVLHPFYNPSSESFIEDELDELYGFPKELTESSSILFALGRRDSKLEYQHKVLSI